MTPSEPSPENSRDLDDLERRLARLSPAGPSDQSARRIGRHLDSLTKRRGETRQAWWRFAPLAAAACFTLVGGWYLKTQLANEGRITEARTAEAPLDESAAAERLFVTPPPIRTGIPPENFVPVSSQEFLRQTRPGAVVELGDDRLPAREIRVEYDDAWHWHDPATRTNIRVFRPREEVILVPIGTD